MESRRRIGGGKPVDEAQRDRERLRDLCFSQEMMTDGGQVVRKVFIREGESLRVLGEVHCVGWRKWIAIIEGVGQVGSCEATYRRAALALRDGSEQRLQRIRQEATAHFAGEDIPAIQRKRLGAQWPARLVA